jgi:hypothetical protein
VHASCNKLAKLLRTTPEVITAIESGMSKLTGQDGVIESIVEENDSLVESVLLELGLTRQSPAEDVYNELKSRFVSLDARMFEYLDKPELAKLSVNCGKLCETGFKVFTPPKGLFIKKEKITELLENNRPEGLLEHFGYATVKELMDKEGFASVAASLRFTQSKEWMHKYFEEAYSGLKPSDFEEREVELKVLDVKWLKIAEKLVSKKFHNLSHLKECGVIFIIPINIDSPGETMRMMTLMFHYLHEVPFYSGLFRKHFGAPDFTDKFKSLLRGDVPKDKVANSKSSEITWRVVQQYLAKDDPNDFRLFEPHVNPEAEHWFRAEEDLHRLSRMIGKAEKNTTLARWAGLDFVGDVFIGKDGKEQLISFDVVDLTMSLATKNAVKYQYHQQEALWNKVFKEYMGRETMNRLMEENIINGFIELR